MECEMAGADPDDFQFWLINTRSMQYAWGSNAGMPLMAEAAKHVPGFKGALINKTVAQEMGLEEGDIMSIESSHAEVEARAVLREGVRPDTVVFTGQFGHWITPFAKDLGVPNMNTLIGPNKKMLDAGGSLSDVVKVRIQKA